MLVSYEVLHYLKTQKTGKNHALVLNLDINKAYDRFKWSFIKAMMDSLGFTDKWIMCCISTVSYSCMISGKKFSYFTPKRGLHQRDPLRIFSCCVLKGFPSCYIRKSVVIVFQKFVFEWLHLLFVTLSFLMIP